jgi:integrase
MSPRKRNREHLGLPTGWRFKHGAYSYRVPPALRAAWGGKTEAKLGRTLPEAYRTWAAKLELQADARTIGDLLDQYALQVVPAKAPKTRESNLISIPRLRAVFGEVPIAAVEPQHAYRYYTKVAEKHGATSARRDVEVLRHALTKAVEWGLLARNPVKGEVRLPARPPRERYVTDAELAAAIQVAGPFLRAYLQVKLLTGLRRGDLLALRREDLREDGLHVRTRKTGKRLVIEWTDALRAALADALAVERKVGSVFVFPNRAGKCYLDEETGRANGFDSLWSRFMSRVVVSGVPRFEERDLRAKSATDTEDLVAASRRLGHSDLRVTQMHYRRRPERVKPLK